MGRWISGLLTGDLGNSYVYSTPVLELIPERLALTVPLAVMAMVLTTVLALAVGVYAASHHNRARRRRRDGRHPGRHRDPQLLVRHPADPAVLGAAALVLGRRLSRLGGRGRAGRHQVAAAAGDLAGRGAGGDPGARHALGGAGGAARGLRAHRARQGPVAARDACGATCCATR